MGKLRIMRFDVEPTSGHGAVIRLTGRLNMVAAPGFRELLAHVLDQEGRKQIVVDLAGTEFMDSTGLGALISGLKLARLAGGDLRIARPGTQVMTVLKLTNLDQILRPHDTVEECFELTLSVPARPAGS
ncbi:STAS domain-containing protein [Pseudarthrobacter sp. CCNWLW217]|uniref:STAS domain-containing protein n=1 Tax=Pseudarthrobacter sp. CCNWLW217 TaxID=3127469 RepID=UPI003FD3673B